MVKGTWKQLPPDDPIFTGSLTISSGGLRKESKKLTKTSVEDTAGQPTPKESLWSKGPWIPSGDPRLQGGFVIGERRSRPLSKNGT